MSAIHLKMCAEPPCKCIIVKCFLALIFIFFVDSVLFWVVFDGGDWKMSTDTHVWAEVKKQLETPFSLAANYRWRNQVETFVFAFTINYRFQDERLRASAKSTSTSKQNQLSIKILSHIKYLFTMISDVSQSSRAEIKKSAHHQAKQFKFSMS